MPKSRTQTFSGNSRCVRRCTTSTPKASSPRKMLPTPATSTLPFTWHLAIQRQRLNFLRREKEAMSGLPQHAEIAPGIVFENNGQMHLVIEIRLDGLDNRNLPLESHVEDVGTLLWPDAHAVACTQRNTECGDALQSGILLLRIPRTHCPLTRRRLRNVPCVFMSCSRAVASVRSSRLRTRSSASCISCFSSSVSVITRNVNISSISVAS